jgi:FlaA1/EpsC-like NDP-sugar epimerase
VLPFALLDTLIILLAYAVTYFVRTEKLPFKASQAGFVVFVVGVTLGALYGFRVYHRLWARTSGHEVTVLVLAAGVVQGVTVLADLALTPRPLPLSVVGVGNLLALIGFVAVRYQSRLISGLSWRWRAVWHYEFPDSVPCVLIVGAGDAGQTTAWRLKYRAPNGRRSYHVVGFVDDDPAKQALYLEGCRVLGTRADIPRLVEQHAVDLIVVAIHNVTGPDFRDILGWCERTPARIKIVPDVFAVLDGTQGVAPLRDIQPEDLLGRQAVGWHTAVDAAPVTGKVVLVTGAAGSIGSELCRQLLRYQPVQLVLLDNNESGLHDLVIELATDAVRERLIPVLADITQRPALERVLARHRPHVVFHAAAYKHVPMLEYFPDESLRVNVGGTRQVAELARDYGVERFVLISTDKAVNPTNVMGASKRLCELLMHALARQGDHTTRFTSVRFGNVLGSRGSVVPTFTRQIEAGGPVTVTDPAMTRYFMTIPEAVNLVIHAACLTQGDDLFMLQMGDVVRIVELAERMIRLRGLRPYSDIPIVFTGTRPGEKLHEELCDGCESTLPTRHPGIVQLVSSRDGCCPDTFFDQLDALLRADVASSSDVLAHLCALIEANQLEPAVQTHA